MRNPLNVLGKKGHHGHLPKSLKRLNKEVVTDAHTHCPFPQCDIAWRAELVSPYLSAI